jgi:DNA repair exonuclease SbcCD ATPase subunit
MGKATITNPFQVPQEFESNLLQIRNEDKKCRKSEKIAQLRETKALPKSGPIPNESKDVSQSSIGGTLKERKLLNAIYRDNDVRSPQNPDGKMSVREFISKKREMLLLNMKIETQHENIEKLHRLIQDREDSLKSKNASLKENIQRFDAFRKETDEKAQSAQRQLENETSKRQKEVMTINQEIQNVESDIAKHHNVLEELLQYKKFVNLLTPSSWFDECTSEKRKRQQQRRRDRINARKEAFRKEQLAMKEKIENLELRGSFPIRRAKKAIANPCEKEQKLLPLPDFEDEPLTSSDEEAPMYFQHPGQLREQFIRLEDENARLDKMIEEGEAKLNYLKAQVQSNHCEWDESRQDNPEAFEVDAKIKELYQKCIESADGFTSDVPTMVSELKTFVDNLVSQTDDMPSDWIEKKLKEKMPPIM